MGSASAGSGHWTNRGTWSPQVFNMKPLQIVFPSRADPESPVVDLDLHLPLLCFRPEQVLQVRDPPDPGRPPLLGPRPAEPWEGSSVRFKPTGRS